MGVLEFVIWKMGDSWCREPRNKAALFSLTYICDVLCTSFPIGYRSPYQWTWGDKGVESVGVESDYATHFKSLCESASVMPTVTGGVFTHKLVTILCPKDWELTLSILAMYQFMHQEDGHLTEGKGEVGQKLNSLLKDPTLRVHFVNLLTQLGRGDYTKLEESLDRLYVKMIDFLEEESSLLRMVTR